jgi:hypothetical protein
MLERTAAVLDHLIVISHDLRVAVDAQERSLDAARANAFQAIEALRNERIWATGEIR